MPIELQDETLSNGIRIITEHNPASKSISLGLWVDVGSRDEEKHQWGCSHFVEHLLFKGTKTRSAKEISSLIENRGGHLNAFTDRDLTAYYAVTLSRDQDTAVNLLMDMVENSLLREQDIEVERKVILEEIKQTLDDPAKLIHDLYIENTWRGNSAAHPVIGNRESLLKMSPEDIREYYKEKYTGNMVAVTAGDVDHEKLVAEIEDLCEKGWGKRAKDRSKPHYHPGRRYVKRDSEQVHLSISTPGHPYGSEDYVVESIISNYLGIGASSLLFQEVREKRDLVYNIYSYNENLGDAGVFSVFASTSKTNLG